MQANSPTSPVYAGRPNPAAQAAVTLFYDGACPLCSREAGHYRKARGSEALGFVDIAAEGFRAQDHGLDPKAVHRTIHAITAAGEVRTGIDASPWCGSCCPVIAPSSASPAPRASARSCWWATRSSPK